MVGEAPLAEVREIAPWASVPPQAVAAAQYTGATRAGAEAGFARSGSCSAVGRAAQPMRPRRRCALWEGQELGLVDYIRDDSRMSLRWQRSVAWSEE